MEFGTFKSEVWAHYKEVGQEYFRYEILTRYWFVNEDESYSWNTTVLRIDREGNVTDVLSTEIDTDWWGKLAQKLKTNRKASKDDPARFYKDRNQAFLDHQEAMMLAAG
jgi:hypothetical protein